MKWLLPQLDAAVWLVAVSASASAADIKGIAKVIDGDTIRIGETEDSFMPKTDMEKLILIRMVLDVNRALIGIGEQREKSIVMMTIRLGKIEGKPVDISAIAAITSLPRASVARHVDALREAGLVKSLKIGRRSIQIPGDILHPAAAKFCAATTRAIRRACKELSKLDTSQFDTTEK